MALVAYLLFDLECARACGNDIEPKENDASSSIVSRIRTHASQTPVDEYPYIRSGPKLSYEIVGLLNQHILFMMSIARTMAMQQVS